MTEIKSLWYIGANGSLQCEGMPYAPEKSLSVPYPSSLWKISGNVVTHELYPEIPEKPIKKSCMPSLWRISENVITHELYPEIPENPVKKPYPKVLWRIENKVSDLPYHELMPFETPAGAFMGAKNLEYARIPETVRKIGRYAFADTALKRVRISSECTYYETSFPSECTIEFYGKIPDEHSGQLYDRDGNTLTDNDGARIYVQEI